MVALSTSLRQPRKALNDCWSWVYISSYIQDVNVNSHSVTLSVALKKTRPLQMQLSPKDAATKRSACFSAARETTWAVGSLKMKTSKSSQNTSMPRCRNINGRVNLFSMDGVPRTQC
eukprot:3970214-Amphidinium_carterae.1